jgi:urease accessory protein
MDKQARDSGGGLTALLILADSRLPAGGHAHSGGLEGAAAAGRVHDVSTVEAFLRGRLHTVGLVAAAFAAAACAAGADRARVAELDDGMDARTPSPALRKASRAQGRALLRAGRAMWTLPAPPSPQPHHPVMLGLCAAAARVSPVQVAHAAAHAAVSGPASAAVRILALDPYPVQALLARLAGACDRVAARAAETAGDAVDDLPAGTAPWLDISAELHATWEVRLFAS